MPKDLWKKLTATAHEVAQKFAEADEDDLDEMMCGINGVEFAKDREAPRRRDMKFPKPSQAIGDPFILRRINPLRRGDKLNGPIYECCHKCAKQLEESRAVHFKRDNEE